MPVIFSSIAAITHSVYRKAVFCSTTKSTAFLFYYPHTSVICVLLWAEKLPDYCLVKILLLKSVGQVAGVLKCLPVSKAITRKSGNLPEHIRTLTP
jgi:hypothetical protein